VGLVRELSKGVRDIGAPQVRAVLLDAASLIMQAEQLAHRMAAGESVNPDEHVRVSHALTRALARLEKLK
jgi:hypothetical protein